MKITVTQSNLRHLLQIACRCAMTGRYNYTALKNVKLWTPADGMLYAGSTNLDTGIVTKTPATVWLGGATTVPAAALLSFASSLEAGNVTLEIKGDKLHVIGEHNKSWFKTISVEDFPTLRDIPRGEIIPLPGPLFRNAIKRTIVATSSEDGRPILNGIYLVIESGTLTLAAADGFRLAVCSMAIGPESPDLQVVVPAKSMAEVAKLSGETINMHVCDDRAMFWTEDTSIESQILRGKFPDYKMILPSHQKVLIVSRELFLQALRISNVVARISNNVVGLHIQDNSLRLLARDAEYADALAEIDARWSDSKPCDISFNTRYLRDALEGADEEDVSLYLGTSDNPGHFKSADGSWQHVLMPMRGLPGASEG